MGEPGSVLKAEQNGLCDYAARSGSWEQYGEMDSNSETSPALPYGVPKPLNSMKKKITKYH